MDVVCLKVFSKRCARPAFGYARTLGATNAVRFVLACLGVRLCAVFVVRSSRARSFRSLAFAVFHACVRVNVEIRTA